eukprot:s29_g59.t1
MGSELQSGKADMTLLDQIFSKERTLSTSLAEKADYVELEQLKIQVHALSGATAQQREASTQEAETTAAKLSALGAALGACCGVEEFRESVKELNSELNKKADASKLDLLTSQVEILSDVMAPKLRRANPPARTIRQKLQAHHSKDDQFLKAISQAMATHQQTGMAWRCATCMKLCGKSHEFCGICGQSWKDCMDPSYGMLNQKDSGSRRVQWTYNPNWNTEQEWNTESWAPSPRRRQSPRRRGNSASKQKHKGKGKGKSVGKGDKGKGKAVDSEEVSFGPPSIASLASPNPPWIASTPPSIPPQPANASIALIDPKPENNQDKQLRLLVAALKKHNDELPEDIQAMVQDVNIRAGQQETKQLHSAVTAHGKAKKELQEAQHARINLHSAWRTFLTQSAAQWQTYTDMFLQQEKQLSERLTHAKEALMQARDSLNSSKAAAGVPVDSKDDSANMSDIDELDAKDLHTGTSAKIAEGFGNLAKNLQTLQKDAEALELDEQQALKRPRVTPPDQSEGDNADGGSKVPFAGPA